MAKKKRKISPKTKKAGMTVISMAKTIRKKSPGKKWTSCMKEAGKKYRAK